MRTLGWSLLVMVVAFLSGSSPSRGERPPRGEVAKIASEWLQSLSDEQRAEGFLPFDSPERRNWNFVPMRRKGVSLAAMTMPQRRLTHRLLQSVLSGEGYLRSTSIMASEAVLRSMAESRGKNGAHRDSEQYCLLIFGDPLGEGPFGFRFEGHHLSLNFSSLAKRVVAITPAFFGTNPAEIREGPSAGLRVLGVLEDEGFELLHSLEESQRATAVIAEKAPSDVFLIPSRKTMLERQEGLAFSQLTSDQKALLWRMIEGVIRQYRGDVADVALARIVSADKNEIFFAWAGASVPGVGHYFRIHGPTFAIEYDNVQDGANHAHLVFRDASNDFGDDVLARHHLLHHDKGR